MKIAVSTFGSEGDFRPFAALTRRLRERGHDAYLTAPSIFAARAAEAGVPMRTTVQVDEPTMRREMTEVMRTSGELRQARRMFDMVGVLMSAPDAATRCKESIGDAEVVVHHMMDVNAAAVARERKLPRITGHLFTGLLPGEGAAADGRSFGRLGNRLSMWLMHKAMTSISQPAMARLAAAAGLPPSKQVLLDVARSPLLNLVAISPALVPTDPLWTGNIAQTGAWFLELPGFSPSPELRAFVEAGPPPVAITFGSMAGTDAVAQTTAVIGALRQTGQRAVLQAGWGMLGAGVALPPNVLLSEYVPHDWLFPRSAGVVHHGGAGTTAAVARSGKPQVVVWHMGDQHAWGSLMQRRGIGAAPISHHKLSAERLARALETIARPEVRQRAEEIGARIRAEDGLTRAAEAIERVIEARA